jgi:hypothetical protein
MRLLTILLLLSIKIYPQKLIKNYYQFKMEEKSIKEFKINKKTITDNRIITLKPNKWVKLTVSSRFNPKPLNKIFRVDNTSDHMNNEDYFNIGQYDMRLKFYLNKKFSILNRLQITGIKINLCSGGIIFKF